MDVFFSWSGVRSKQLAGHVASWLRLVVAHSRPWMSDADLDAGKRWSAELSAKLASTHFGVACVTPENADAPWLLFEAGALAKSLESARLVPLLLDMTTADLSPPLSQFQALEVSRDGMLRLAMTIAERLPAEAVRRDDVSRLFELTWPSLELELEAISKAVIEVQSRDSDSILAEILAIARRIDAKVANSAEVASAPLAPSVLELLNRELFEVNRDHDGLQAIIDYHSRLGTVIPTDIEEQHRTLRVRSAELRDAILRHIGSQTSREVPRSQ